MNNNKNVFCTQINLEEHYQTNIFIDKNIFNNGFYEDSENIKSKLLDYFHEAHAIVKTGIISHLDCHMAALG